MPGFQSLCQGDIVAHAGTISFGTIEIEFVFCFFSNIPNPPTSDYPALNSAAPEDQRSP
ncbi:unnamed protein product, partial [Amoebophrya sp. A120]